MKEPVITVPRAPGDPHPDSTDEEERRAAHLRWARDKADRLERMRDAGDTNTPADVDDQIRGWRDYIRDEEAAAASRPGSSRGSRPRGSQAPGAVPRRPGV